MIIDRYKCIFVHIPKTAGCSIERALTGENTPSRSRHMDIHGYRSIIDKGKFESYFKFSIVRNPWDRIVSAYAYLSSSQYFIEEKRWKSSFENFLYWSKKMKYKGLQLNFIASPFFSYNHSKKEYDYDKSKIELLVDYVGRFENLGAVVKELENRFSLRNVILDHIVKSDRNPNYKQYYTTKTKNIVDSMCAGDIDYFGYTF